MMNFEICDSFQMPNEERILTHRVNAVVTVSTNTRHITEYMYPMSVAQVIKKIEKLDRECEYVEWYLLNPKTRNMNFISLIHAGVFRDWQDRVCIHDKETGKWHYYGYEYQPYSLIDLTVPIEEGVPQVDGIFEDGVLLKDGAFFRKGANDMYYLSQNMNRNE